MSIHIFELNDSTQIKDIAGFLTKNMVKEGDEIVLNMNITYDFNYIFRHVFFIMFREGISTNKKGMFQKPLAKLDYTSIADMYDNDTFSKKLFEETGVICTFK